MVRMTRVPDGCEYEAFQVEIGAGAALSAKIHHANALQPDSCAVQVGSSDSDAGSLMRAHVAVDRKTFRGKAGEELPVTAVLIEIERIVPQRGGLRGGASRVHDLEHRGVYPGADNPLARFDLPTV